MSTEASFIDQMVAEADDAAQTIDKSGDAAGAGKDAIQSTEAPATGDVQGTAKDKIDPSKPDDKPEKVVPLRALQEEREAAKELKRQIAELQAQPKLSEEDRQLLAELKAAKASQAKPKDVDFMDDPKGYVDTKVQAALDKLAAIDTKAETTGNQVTAQQQFNALMTAISTSETAFVAQNPDYYDALNHVRTVRANQIRLMDPSIDDTQINKLVAQEELTAAHQLIQKGADPCKFAMEYAKTIGYTKKEAIPTLPKAEADKSAARTMGSGGADAPDAMDEDDPNAEFLAVKEAFRRR